MDNRMSKVAPCLPRLTVNRRFITEFISADTPCFALGMVEVRKRHCGFLAIRPDQVIPAQSMQAGFRFGYSLFGNAAFLVVHFAFEFYGFQTYNVLVNPNNLIVQTVLTTMVESVDYFMFSLHSNGEVTTFRSELDTDDLVGLKTNLPRIQGATTTEEQYRKAVASFVRNPEPAGVLANWVCRDSVASLDLTRDRLDLTPS
jgi:hypothetical protein